MQCTRNNDFSNRNQKAVITIDPKYVAATTTSFSKGGGTIDLGLTTGQTVQVTMAAGATSRAVDLQINVLANTVANSAIVRDAGPVSAVCWRE